jgi:hypothetical protein
MLLSVAVHELKRRTLRLELTQPLTALRRRVITRDLPATPNEQPCATSQERKKQRRGAAQHPGERKKPSDLRVK